MLGAVNVYSFFNHREEKRFLENSFGPIAVDGCHCLSSTQKLPPSAKPGTELASQSIRLSYITAPESESLRNHEFSELSNCVTMLSGLVFRNAGGIAVLKSLLKYSGTFDSSDDVSFQKASVNNFTRDLVSCRLFQGAVESGSGL